VEREVARRRCLVPAGWIAAVKRSTQIGSWAGGLAGAEAALAQAGDSRQVRVAGGKRDQV
jgi:hypothetical protein